MAQDSGHNLAGSPALAVKVLARAGAHLKDQLEKDQLPGHVVFGSIRFPADCWTKGLSFWLALRLRQITQHGSLLLKRRQDRCCNLM